jgi:hypothetical protein
MSIRPTTFEEAYDFLSRYPPPEKWMQGMYPHMRYFHANECMTELQEIATRKKVAVFFITIGILLILAGVAFCMASNKILPAGDNLISNLGAGGHGIAICTLVFGVLPIIFASVKIHGYKEDSKRNHRHAFTHTHIALRCIVAPKLKENELLIMDHEDGVLAFYSESNERPWAKKDDTHFGFPKTKEPLWTKDWFLEEARTGSGDLLIMHKLEDDITFVSLEELKTRFDNAEE